VIPHQVVSPGHVDLPQACRGWPHSSAKTLTAETQVLSLTFTPTGTVNYTTPQLRWQVVVHQAMAAITWGAAGGSHYGPAFRSLCLFCPSQPELTKTEPTVSEAKGAEEQQLAGFIAKFDSKHAALIHALRRALRRRLPAAHELVYDNYNFFVIGYCSSERPSDCIVSIAASANGVGLSFYYGATLGSLANHHCSRPRQAEPSLDIVSTELGVTQFDNFERGFDGESDLAGRPTRRTDLPRRAFGRADEAQPQASRRKRRRDPNGEPSALLGFIEDVKAAAIENEMEGTIGLGSGQKIQGCETTTRKPTPQFRVGSFDRQGGDIDAQHVEAALRQPDRIRPRARADLQRPRGPNPA